MWEVQYDVIDENVVEGEEAQSRRISVFEVEDKLLHNSRILGIYHSDPQVEFLKHMSIADCVVQVLLKVLPAAKMLGLVD